MFAISISIPTDAVSPIQDLGLFVGNIVGTILILAAVASFIYLVMGGVEWILAGSDKGKVEEARSRITNAILGLAVAAAAWAIFSLADYFFGLNIANKTSDLTLPSNSVPSGSSSSSGSSGSSNSSLDTCSGGRAVGWQGSDGGAGGYCTNGGAATVRCVGKNVGGIPYAHYEPVSCNPPNKFKDGVKPL